MKRILLVDDDEDVLQSTQLALQDSGFEVIVAHDGTQALACAERDAPDLILLDVVMPMRSGLSVLQRLRRAHSRTPRIVVMTANIEDRYAELAETGGADAFIRKPFDIDELLQTIHALLS